ncbi:MAG: hypothetical protein AB7H86_21135 [Blastocatellales bacterium]
MRTEESKDTGLEIADMVRTRLMEYSGAERMIMGSRMFDSARAMSLASLPAGLTDIDRKAMLCQRLYGQEIDQAGFILQLRKSVR